MNKTIINHFKQYGMFTFPACYEKKLKNDLPNDIKKIGHLVRSSFIHRTTLANGNTGTNTDKKYGDMKKIPWHQQAEDDYLPTVGAILIELYRRDAKGFHKNRKEKDKLILTCRFTAITIAAILKAKGIACRVRSGFAPYFTEHTGDDRSWDHWINQYWYEKKNKWVTIDVDGSRHDLNFDPYDIQKDTFDFAASAWINVRNNKVEENHFYNAGGFLGLYPMAWALTYDLHCLMNREIIYLHGTKLTLATDYFAKKPLPEKTLKKFDILAKLLLNPNKNFNKLKKIWETKREFRILVGGLL